ncbi:hypothetical protein RvY_09867-2 [Ramazzottius varieornatus]|uniref:Ion transport domain-containing protein n=1 Tax=Ramazzottius varieornatus TaxID=947166 RepID=A0A1D1VAU5_RAMVA|nr:hypothetical protein RvY_09867-2 [Ramazzottius varieornatus]
MDRDSPGFGGKVRCRYRCIVAGETNTSPYGCAVRETGNLRCAVTDESRPERQRPERAYAVAFGRRKRSFFHRGAFSESSSRLKSYDNGRRGWYSAFFTMSRPTMMEVSPLQNGYTVAHIAAQNGSDEVVRLLMSFDKQQVITAKIRTDDSTALHLAAAGGHAEVVKVLVEGGASPVEENADGMTPLHLAAKFGYVSVLEILKELISLKLSSVKTGLSALHLAAFYGQVEFARELLTTVPATIVSDQPTINNAIVKEIGGEPGLTPLHLAAHSGQENMVRLLLNYPGVQVDAAADISGLIPLHLAALNGHLPIVGLLLSKSSAQLDTRDKKGRNALMLAGANGHEEMASLLLGQGADVASEDNNGWTALHHAAKAGYLKVVKVLVEAGASPVSETSDGKIPLCYAANALKTDVLTYLILKDHDVFKLLEDRAFLFDLMNCGKMFHQKALEDFITTSPSPVEIALKLSRFYQDQSSREKELERDSILASKFCETLGNDLLTISCNRFGPALVLRAIDQNNKSLMDILVEGSHKEVVAEPSVQRFLSDVWYGNQEWSDGKSTMMFLAFLLFPPFWLVMSLPIGRYSEIPFMKLMSSIVSHLFFIVVLILVFLSPFENLYDRIDPLPEWAEWLLLVWLIGKVIDEFFTAEERSGLGWIRIIVLGFCALGIIMHGIAFAFTGTTATILLYVRNQLFATAGLFACIQIVNYLSFHYMFGPMGIIIQDLVKDLMRFLVVLSLFMIGFSFSSSAMFLDTQQPNMTESGYYYPHSVIIDMASDPLVSFQYLYFALFGLVDPTHMPAAPNSPPFSSTLIKILVMIFLMVTMVVLINLLIAMLSDTYQRIQARSDLEWKFGRAKLIINTQKSAISPPPLNVITVSATYAYKGLKKCMSMRRGGGSGSTEELAPSGKTSREGSHVLSWRKSFQDSGEGGASAHFKKVPVKRLVDVIDWESVVSAYRGGSATDYELENTAVLLGIEQEI